MATWRLGWHMTVLINYLYIVRMIPSSKQCVTTCMAPFESLARPLPMRHQWLLRLNAA